jgi:hypothetical protein
MRENMIAEWLEQTVSELLWMLGQRPELFGSTTYCENPEESISKLPDLVRT